MRAKHAIMVHTQRRRVTTNAGYTISFEPDVEKFVPGIVVQQALKHGAEIVRYTDGSMQTQRSANPLKVPELVSSSSTMHTPEQDDTAEMEAAAEYVESSSEEDRAEEVAAAVDELGSFTQKEARIKNAILTLMSENDADKFVATTGRPKVSALSAVLGGENLTSQVRDMVWAKMEGAGIFDEAEAD